MTEHTDQSEKTKTYTQDFDTNPIQPPNSPNPNLDAETLPNRIHKQKVTKKNNPKQDNNISRYYITNKTLTQEDKTIVGTKPHQPAKEDQMPRNRFLNKCNHIFETIQNIIRKTRNQINSNHRSKKM